jgi:intein/homing endonuclease
MKKEIFYYILGFIYGDGSSDGRRITIRLSKKDKEHLVKISYEIFQENKVKDYYSKCQTGLFESCRLDLNYESSQLFIRAGILKNKTYLEESDVFDQIKDNYKKDFIRGYFDADGSVILTKENSSKLIWSLTSKNLKILQKIQTYLEKVTNHRTPLKNDKTSRIFRLIQSGNKSVCLIYSNLYYKNCFCLKRKQNVFLKICQGTLG